MSTNENTDSDFWLRLDNAAKIYPAVISRELTSVLRISVELTERIKARQFSDAITAIQNRFPYYKVKLKAGFFWYFLDYENLPLQVKADSDIPCRAFGKDEIMFRVLFKGNRLSVEFSHVLTDGTGAFEFLKTLLLCYFEKCGFEIPADVDVLKATGNVSEEEYEDAFNKFFTKKTAPGIKVTEAFHLPFPLKPKPRFSILLGIIPIREIVEKAKEHEVSITEYLIAVYLYALQEVFGNLSEKVKKLNRKKARIEVPVNLRKIFPSHTMRNFSLYVMPEIDFRLGKYSFEELVKVVYHQMRMETDKKLINKIISKNVGSERNLVIKSIPLVLKSLLLSKVYQHGVRKYSGVLTNMGKIDLSPELNKHIKRFIFIPPPPNRDLKVNCGMVGFNNQLVLSFGNITKSRELERTFFTFLVQQGIPVKIEILKT